MANNVKTNSKKPTKKKKQKKTKEIILILSAAALLCYILVAIIIIILNQPPKSYEEVEKILYENSYKTYFFFNYRTNTYDKNGKCYKFGDSKQTDCKREINLENHNQSFIDVSANDDFSMGATYDITTNQITEISIILHKKLNDTDIANYSHTFSSKDGVDYLKYYSTSDDDCYIINKSTDDSFSANKTICSDNKKDDLLNYSNEANNILKAIHISEQDLSSYFSEYIKKYVLPQYNKQKSIAKTKLPYETIQKYIKNAGFTIEKENDAVRIYDNWFSSLKKFDHFFLFKFSDNKLSSLTYTDGLIYEGYALSYFSEMGAFIGGDLGLTCSYVVDSNTSIKNYILSGYCSDSDKEKVTQLYNFSFKGEIEDMQLTRDELFNFIGEYYKKN